MEQSLRRISKFLSFVLRHHPDEIGLTLDRNGWVDVQELLDAANRSGRSMNREQLMAVVANNDKRRFALSEDGTKIRASQGHSVDVELGLSPVQPPDVLFHGTVERFFESIRGNGLHSGSRQHVHLSPDRATATAVGQRRGRPAILTIQAAKMHSDGFEFFLSANGVWLTDTVPVRYIEFP